MAQCDYRISAAEMVGAASGGLVWEKALVLTSGERLAFCPLLASAVRVNAVNADGRKTALHSCAMQTNSHVRKKHKRAC
jgi:hypothetical protein